MTIWRMRISCWVYNIYFPRQQHLQVRALILRYTYSASLVKDPTGFHFRGVQATSSSKSLSEILKESSTSHVCCTSRPHKYPNNVTRPGILTRSGSDTHFGDPNYHTSNGSSKIPRNKLRFHVKKKTYRLKNKRDNWLIGKKSHLSIENKLLIYKAVIKQICSYGIELWSCTSKSDIVIMQRSQSKILRAIANAPW